MSGKGLPHESPVEFPLGNDHQQPQEQVQSEKEVEPDQSYSLGDEDDDDKFTMEIDVSLISESLECPICLGVLRKTKMVKKCLHRFCGECIEKCIRLWKNECPVCPEPSPGGFTLRDDHVYDRLISIFHPDIDKYEEESLRRDIEELNRKRRARATAVAFAGRRRMIRNALERQISNDNEVMNDNNAGKELLSGAENTEAESNKGEETQVLLESANADGTGDENTPDVNTE